jgi:hypothetical protein
VAKCIFPARKDVMENFDEAIESFQKALDLKVMPDGQTNPTFTYPEECWTRASLLQRLPVSQGKIHQEKLATIFQQVCNPMMSVKKGRIS